jgi:uncharacterized protein involved in exopolysaccharide biosynthesis
MINWKWFVFSAIIALIAGAIYGRMQQDVFEVNSSVLIMDQTRSGQMSELSVLKQLDAAGFGGSRSSSMINNEEQVIRSTALMLRVVNRLELYTTYTRKSFLKTEDLYTSSPLYVRIDSLSLLKLKSTLRLNIVPDKGKLAIEGNFKDSSFFIEAKQLPTTLVTPAGTIYIQLRPENEFPEYPIEVTISNPLRVAKSISGSILTTEVVKCGCNQLKARTTNIRKAQDILNSLAEVYNQDASEQSNMSAINTAIFIDGRLKLLANDLSDVERDVETYKQVNKLTDIEGDAKMYLNKNDLYDNQRIAVEMQQNLIKYIDEFIQNPANQKALIPNLGLTDVGLVNVINTYNDLIISRDRIASGSSENNPALKTLDQQINTTRKAIQTSIASSRKGLQISNEDLKNQNMLLQSKIREIPSKEREYFEIKRQQQVKASLYLFLLQKREEASLNMAVTVPKSRVLNTPDDAVHVGPNRNLILLIFMLIGLIIPGLGIYLMELINTKIRNREDLEKLTDIPIITGGTQ